MSDPIMVSNRIETKCDEISTHSFPTLEGVLSLSSDSLSFLAALSSGRGDGLGPRSMPFPEGSLSSFPLLDSLTFGKGDGVALPTSRESLGSGDETGPAGGFAFWKLLGLEPLSARFATSGTASLTRVKLGGLQLAVAWESAIVLK